MMLVLLTHATAAQTDPASLTCADLAGRTSLMTSGHYCYELDSSHPGTLAAVGGGSCDDYFVTSDYPLKRLCYLDGDKVCSTAMHSTRCFAFERTNA